MRRKIYGKGISLKIEDQKKKKYNNVRKRKKSDEK